LVNNMPDAALAATERQFAAVLKKASGGRDVQLCLLELPGVQRGDVALSYMAGRYRSTATLFADPVDALIVTGAEPLAADLRDEPYWSSLTALIDWAQTNTVSTLFSCLAAHAAVLHLDGIQRRPLLVKCSGVFAMETATHPLTSMQAQPLLVPHSRCNDLPECDLVAKGYQILTRSTQTGVDAFIKDRGSLLVFLQGHPEYGAEALMLEYRRDMRRFLNGQRDNPPAIPIGYFNVQTEQALHRLATRHADRGSLDRLAGYAKIFRTATPKAPWVEATTQLYRNWLTLIDSRLEAGSIGPIDCRPNLNGAMQKFATA
jgi:homoserine O-succinyltransferase/O-acetyltransferase